MTAGRAAEKCAFFGWQARTNRLTARKDTRAELPQVSSRLGQGIQPDQQAAGEDALKETGPEVRDRQLALDPKSDRIKQGRLAVRSFGELIRQVPEMVGPEPRITVIGLNSDRLVLQG